MTTQIRLENVRITFPQVFEAKAVNGEGEPAFSATFHLPKSGHPGIALVRDTIVIAAKDKWGAKAEEIVRALKAANRLCLHDGEEKSQYPGFKDTYFIAARNKQRPLVVDGKRAPLTEADGKIYSGCYVNAIITLWAQDNKFGKRVNASLLGVQFFADGERLAGGGVAAADDFEPIPQAEASPSSGAGALFD